MWPFRNHTAMGSVSSPSNSHLEAIERMLAKMGLLKTGTWIPNLDHLSMSALFQRPGHSSVYRAEAYTDAGGTHCRVVQELGQIVLSAAGAVASCSIKGYEVSPAGQREEDAGNGSASTAHLHG